MQSHQIRLVIVLLIKRRRRQWFRRNWIKEFVLRVAGEGCRGRRRATRAASASGSGLHGDFEDV